MIPIDERRERNAAVVARHSSWRGIRHPELIPFPPARFSRLDMLPVLEHARAWPAGLGATTVVRGPRVERIERSRDIVAAHERWHGIIHPDRIVFPELMGETAALLSYRAAVRLAVGRVREGDDLCRRIDAVAEAIGRRPWPWAASPAELPAEPPTPPSPPARLRTWRLPSLRLHVSPHRSLIAH